MISLNTCVHLRKYRQDVCQLDILGITEKGRDFRGQAPPSMFPPTEKEASLSKPYIYDMIIYIKSGA